MILASVGKKQKKIIYPMPKVWQNLIEKEGFSIKKNISGLLFYLIVFFFWLYGFYYFFLIIWEILTHKKTVKFKNFSQVIFIKDLSKADYDSRKDNYENILSKVKMKYQLENFCHDNKDLIQQTKVNKYFQYTFLPFNQLPNIKLLFIFIIRSLFFIFQSVFNLFFGKWQNALMLKELILADFFNYIPKESLPSILLFDHTKFTYRPLWTYIVEKKGAKPILYFYSTNNETILLDKNTNRSNSKWSIMSWSNYWVWNFEQEDFIKRITSNDSNIEVVGPILTGNNVLIDEIKLPKKSVTVFDVQPHRDFRYQLYCEPFEYFIPEVTNKFLDDIYNIVKDIGATMVYKGKRNIGKLSHYKHRLLIKELSMKKEVKIVEASINAKSLILNSNCIISFPFTSTALIGKMHNKPSVYYDPTGKINKQDPAANGISIISGPLELKNWLTIHLV
jgi:polysaccharide biosynthesis PFTS motif protein